MGFDSWIDRHIEKAVNRGEFDNLPGLGKPQEISTQYDENWWAKALLAREGISYLPPALAMRKAVSDAVKGAMAAPSEAEVRRIAETINEQIREALREPVVRGPAIDVSPLDVDALVRRWKFERPS